MDCPEVKGESPAEEQLEPLLILEEGDEPEEFTNNTAREKNVLRVRKTDEDLEEDSGGDNGSVERGADADAEGKEGNREEKDVEVNESKVEKPEGQQEEALESESGGPDQEKNSSDGSQVDSKVNAVPAEAGEEKVAGKEMEGPLLETDAVAKDKLHVAPDVQLTAKLRPRDRLRPEDAQQKVHRLSPDFPDTLYELLCTLQEGRRLNDQRCSFRLEARRRCYSEPSTPRHSQKVVFSSMTSLQKEEFFDLVATSQGRRLDDQRAEFQSLSPVPSSPEPQPSTKPADTNSSADGSAAAAAAPTAATLVAKAKSRRGSCKAPEASRTVPKPPAKEELYNMILTSQAQGRLEEQRSKPPGPMDDEDFFSLLLKVQGGRMDEQRTELPVTLKY